MEENVLKLMQFVNLQIDRVNITTATDMKSEMMTMFAGYKLVVHQE